MTVNINYTLEKIAEIINGDFIRQAPAAALKYLLLDSRKLTFPETTLFFALHSDRTKNKNLVEELHKKGVSNFVIREDVDRKEFSKANFVIVDRKSVV